MILYRPVGLNELQLIAQEDLCAFPPRLPDQPIFYPVLNFQYAEQIARDWNTKEPPYAGFVTRFEVEDEYVGRYEIQTVGSSIHRELWVPAEELVDFNSNIKGCISVVQCYYGEKFVGRRDPESGLPMDL